MYGALFLRVDVLLRSESIHSVRWWFGSAETSTCISGGNETKAFISGCAAENVASPHEDVKSATHSEAERSSGVWYLSAFDCLTCFLRLIRNNNLFSDSNCAGVPTGWGKPFLIFHPPFDWVRFTLRSSHCPFDRHCCFLRANNAMERSQTIQAERKSSPVAFRSGRFLFWGNFGRWWPTATRVAFVCPICHWSRPFAIRARALYKLYSTRGRSGAAHTQSARHGENERDLGSAVCARKREPHEQRMTGSFYAKQFSDFKRSTAFPFGV